MQSIYSAAQKHLIVHASLEALQYLMEMKNQVTVEFISEYQVTVRREEYIESVMFLGMVALLSVAIIHLVT